jgi:uncharacterized protein YndB with AHSA1/START domain
MPRPVEHVIHIAASVEVVWRLLVRPEGLVEWWGVADVDLQPGGQFRVQMLDGPHPVMSGTVTEFTAGERLVLTFGWEQTDGSPPLPPGASRLEITLLPDRGGTLLTLRHHQLPPGLSTETRAGWVDYLGRLRRAAAGG